MCLFKVSLDSRSSTTNISLLKIHTDVLVRLRLFLCIKRRICEVL